MLQFGRFQPVSSRVASLILMAADDRGGEALGNLIRGQGVTHATLPPVVLADLAADAAVADAGGGRRGVLTRTGRALVGGPAHDQCLWADRDDGVRDDERAAVGPQRGADRPSDNEHAGLCFGWRLGACADWGCGGALRCGAWGLGGAMWVVAG